METARASEAVSTRLTAIYGLMVRLLNMVALRSRFPFSSSTSREHRIGKLLSGEKAVVLARLFSSPYFAVKLSYRRFSSRCSRSTISSGALSVWYSISRRTQSRMAIIPFTRLWPVRDCSTGNIRLFSR